jgi:hypothetical protein
MSRGLSRLLVAVVVSGLARGIAAAQTGGGTAPLSGQVTDPNDAVVPGVTVVVRNQATGVSLAPVVTNREGIFSVAALDPGTYTVTFSLTGFKMAVVQDVPIVTATPTDLKVKLEVGPVNETVAVQARSSVIQTHSTAISSTLYADQMRNLPLNTRDALNFVTLLPGVDTGSTHVQRNSTLITGLPLAAILVSIDGVPTQSPLAKSQDGFWSIISPNIDAMEEVTISTATPGAEASGQGAIQIRFTTKSGTEKYAGSFFETWRHPVLYANTFFNKVGGLPVSHIVVNDFGGNVGGPIPLPGSRGPKRAFFFTNLDWLNQASEVRRVRTVLSPSARAGLFTYTGGGVTRVIDILALAGQNGQVATADPTIAGLLSEMAAATATTGSLEVLDANTLRYAWNSPDELLRRHSTTRIDVDVGPAGRVSGTYNFNKYRRDPDTLTNRDPRLPGLSSRGSNTSFRNAASSTLRSTLSPNVVNEASVGAFWQTNDGAPELSRASFANQGGYTLTLAGGGPTGTTFVGLSPATAGMGTEANGNGNRSAENPNVLWSLADRMSWQRGRHGLQIGGELTRVKSLRMDQQVVPAVAFGIVPGDPADGVFKLVNFPDASTANVADAAFLYALLTGRVASITTEFALDPETGQYVKNGRTNRRTHMPEMGLFVQDAFRVAPNLTLNLGLRYELQFPLRADNSVYAANTIADACGVSGLGPGLGGRPCNFFMPGTLTGGTPDYEQYRSGTTRYGSDLDNLAPSVGLAWLPGVKTGFLRAVLGDPDQATLRASYARAYYREGLNRYAVPYENNPGSSTSAVRSAVVGNLTPGEVLFRETGKLGPGEVPPPPSYPLAIDRTAGVNLFDPHWEVGYADSFSAGIQRSLSRDMAIEVRYVGTRGRNLIEIENWNEINVIENGFLDEFKLAQANLAANMAAGVGNTIAYRGPGTGTSPLPTYLAYFTGSRNAGDPQAYTGPRWNDGTVVGRFAPFNPNPGASAGDLHNLAAQRANALRAGVPANFFVLNPDVTPVMVHVSKGSTRYDAIQLELRRRLSGGLAMTSSYSYVKMWASRLDTLRRDRVLAPSVAAVPHSLKIAASYDVPFGRERRFGAGVNSWVQAVAGGWSVNITGKVTSGQILSFGNVRLVGMTRDELQRSIEYRIVSVNPDGTPGPMQVYNLPQDVIDNTIKAFSVNLTGYSAGAPTGRYFAPANGPDCIQAIRGDCAPADVQAVAPPFSRFDFGARKRLGLGGKVTLLVEVDVLNLFNAINFNPIALPANPVNRASYQISESYSDVNNLADPGSRMGQLVFRLNW